MGYNRSGVRRTARLKRAKKYFARLLAKQEAAAKQPPATVQDDSVQKSQSQSQGT